MKPLVDLSTDAAVLFDTEQSYSSSKALARMEPSVDLSSEAAAKSLSDTTIITNEGDAATFTNANSASTTLKLPSRLPASEANNTCMAMILFRPNTTDLSIANSAHGTSGSDLGPHEESQIVAFCVHGLGANCHCCFTLFRKLPMEMRFMIWKLFPPGRVILSSWLDLGDERLRWTWSRVPPPPVLSRINKESRQIFKEIYTAFPTHQIKKKFMASIYINLEIDYFYIQEDKEIEALSVYLAKHGVRKSGKSVGPEHLRYLAVNLDDFGPDYLEGIPDCFLKIPEHFPHLKDLSFTQEWEHSNDYDTGDSDTEDIVDCEDVVRPSYREKVSPVLWLLQRPRACLDKEHVEETKSILSNYRRIQPQLKWSSIRIGLMDMDNRCGEEWDDGKDEDYDIETF